MTTIRTIDDLVRILDERPDWTESLRSRILTRELLDLPQAFAEFAANTERRLTALETGQAELATVLGRFMDNTERRLAALEAGQVALTDALTKFMESTERRLNALESGQAALVAGQVALESGQAALAAGQVALESGQAALESGQAALAAAQAALADTLAKFMESTERRLDAVGTKLDQHTNEMAPLKAAHARNGALRIVARIARVANCREHRVLDLGDILNLIDDSDTSGIARNELTSFENADIIIEATPRDNGAVHYIAVEASYTAGRRDAYRAIRNAEYMTRFTGRPAHAVVAAQRVNPAIEHLLESGELQWTQILQKELETD